MAIEKADILIEVNDNLNTKLTDIDRFIQKTLDDLSEEDLLTDEDDSQTLSNGGLTLDEPDGYRAMVALTLTVTSGSSEQFPLIKLPGGQRQYRALRHNDNAVGIPRWFSQYKGKFYLWRPANQDFSALIEYYKDHPVLSGETGGIEFGDNFRNVIYAGATFYTALKFSRAKALQIWSPMYESAKQKRINAFPRQPRITRG